MKNGKLVGCINSLKASGLIKTRFFYLNTVTTEVKDVTEELYLSIQKFNNYADQYRETGFYMVKIPYSLKNGLAVYSYGCGLTHYLNEKLFEEISIFGEGILSFPLTECSISIYTPDEVKHVLECNNVFDENIFTALQKLSY